VTRFHGAGRREIGDAGSDGTGRGPSISYMEGPCRLGHLQRSGAFGGTNQDQGDLSGSSAEGQLGGHCRRQNLERRLLRARGATRRPARPSRPHWVERPCGGLPEPVGLALFPAFVQPERHRPGHGTWNVVVTSTLRSSAAEPLRVRYSGGTPHRYSQHRLAGAEAETHWLVTSTPRR
jgi:hypothetical protein